MLQHNQLTRHMPSTRMFAKPVNQCFYKIYINLHSWVQRTAHAYVEISHALELEIIRISAGSTDLHILKTLSSKHIRIYFAFVTNCGWYYTMLLHGMGGHCEYATPVGNAIDFSAAVMNIIRYGYIYIYFFFFASISRYRRNNIEEQIHKFGAPGKLFNWVGFQAHFEFCWLTNLNLFVVLEFTSSLLFDWSSSKGNN